jgi:uncharacterized membrane-anchored protein
MSENGKKKVGFALPEDEQKQGTNMYDRKKIQKEVRRDNTKNIEVESEGLNSSSLEDDDEFKAVANNCIDIKLGIQRFFVLIVVL